MNAGSAVRALTAGALAVLAAAALVTVVSARQPPAEPIAVVVRDGGFCMPGACRSVLRIDTATISGDGFVPRRLLPGERAALLRAIARLDLGYLRAHPFRGTCPIAYDGQESTYRFAGFPRRLASCTYDLRGVAAVRVVERLLATLEPKQR